MEIEEFVREAVDALAEKHKGVMNNVVFLVEDEARPKKKGESVIKRNETLLGLYEGIPKTKRTYGYFGVMPDKITIFQKPLERLSGGDRDKLRKLVFQVVWHEVGHHLGFNEKEIRELEAKKWKRE